MKSVRLPRTPTRRHLTEAETALGSIAAGISVDTTSQDLPFDPMAPHGRIRRFAELDRLIAREEAERKHAAGRPRGSKNGPKVTSLPAAMITARPYRQNGIMQREAHRKAKETLRQRREKA